MSSSRNSSQLQTETGVVPAGEYHLSEHLGSLVEIPEFQMDRFPISVAQYQTFIDAGGYEDYDFWDDDGWHWLQTEQITHPRLWDANNPDHDGMFTKVQGDLLTEFVQPNKPVIGVSWFEADAFCRFYNRRLPSEAEWEAAARGLENFTYPWGNEWMADGIGAWGNRSGSKRVTAAIGQFPESKGPFGHEGLVGNIWQWTTTPWDSSDDQGAITAKGGSWGSPSDQCTNGSRNGFKPRDQWTHVGFRTIVV